MIFQLFSLIVLISNYSIGVDCYVQIHPSSVWIPLLYSNISQPLFMFHTDYGFLQTGFSRELNSDPSRVGPGGMILNLTKSYSVYANHSTNLLYSQDNMLTAEFLVLGRDYFALKTDRVIRDVIERRRIRWIPLTSQNFAMVTFFQRYVNRPTEFQLMVFNFDRSITFVRIGSIDESFRSMTVLHGFKHENEVYTFGSRTQRNGATFYYIAQTSTTNEIVYYEQYSTNFINIFGNISKVQFVYSDLAFRMNYLSFSQLLFMTYRNVSDRLAVFPLSEVIPAFRERFNCIFGSSFWTNLHLDRASTCVRYSHTEYSFFLREWELGSYRTFNILAANFNFNRIVDFVPLALKATLGYVLLVLSSNTGYTSYRYSIHSIDSNYMITNHPNERIFSLSARPNNQTKIYYYDHPYPQVLITLNQYHYNEPLDLCPFLSNSCLDCITTKVFVNRTSYRFCSWSHGTDTHSGTCSLDTSTEPIRTDSFSTTYNNSCFRFERVTTVYLPLTYTFIIYSDLNGYHETISAQFSFRVYLATATTTLHECRAAEQNGSIFMIQCSQVIYGDYALLTNIYRESRTSNYENTNRFTARTHLLSTENSTLTEPTTTTELITTTTPIITPQPTDIITDPTTEPTTEPTTDPTTELTTESTTNPPDTQPPTSESSITSTESNDLSESSKSSIYAVLIIIIIIVSMSLSGYFLMQKKSKKSQDANHNPRNIKVFKSKLKTDSNLRIKSAPESLLALKAISNSKTPKTKSKKVLKSDRSKNVSKVKSPFLHQFKSKSTTGSVLESKGIKKKTKKTKKTKK